MSTEETTRLERRLKREKMARKEAEHLLETKSREVFEASQALERENLRVARKSTEIQLLHDVIAAGHVEQSFTESLRDFVHAVCDLTGWPLGYALVPSEDEPNQLQLVADSLLKSAPASCRDTLSRSKVVIGEGAFGSAFRSGTAQLVTDPLELPPVSCDDDRTLESGFLVPIEVYGEIVALVAFFTPHAAEVQEKYAETVSTAGSQLGAVLERRRSEQEVRDNYEELKQTQAQLVQNEKLASLGQLAAGVAHEINNPMGFVTSNLNSLAEYHEDLTKAMTSLTQLLDATETTKDAPLLTHAQSARAVIEDLDIEFVLEDIADLIRETIEGGDRIRKIVADLKDFSHVDSSEMTSTNLNELIEKTLSVARNELKYCAKVETSYGELPEILCYGGKLGQVFLNLFVNAAHAMKDAPGSLRVTTTTDGDFVTCSVADTGCGISEEHVGKIFDPFFTTKPVGEGTGLGLNLSYKIVESHGGQLSVESTVGEGTCFTVVLPVSGPPQSSE